MKALIVLWLAMPVVAAAFLFGWESIVAGIVISSVFMGWVYGLAWMIDRQKEKP